MMCQQADFYPRSPCGERRKLLHPSRPGKINFYPRSPCGERRIFLDLTLQERDFYPRSPCGERRWLRCWQLAARDISIHALLAESDDCDILSIERCNSFLSTLSLRRATFCFYSPLTDAKYFYPRSPCGERRIVPLLGIN